MKRTLTFCILLFAFCIFLTACDGLLTQEDIDNAVNAATAPLNSQITALEAQNAALKNCAVGNHTYSYTVGDDGTHTYTCSACGTGGSENHVSAIGENGICACGIQFAAGVGNTAYATFDEALSAWADGTTLKLYTDITATATITLTDKAVTLDLNGHSYVNRRRLFNVNEGAALTITDTSDEADGLLHLTADNDYAIATDSTLTFSGGRIASAAKYNATIYVTGGTLNVTGGIVENTSGAAIDLDGSCEGVISGGKVIGRIVAFRDLTVTGAPTIDTIVWWEGVVDLSAMTSADNLVIQNTNHQKMTVGTHLILPNNMQLQIDTIPVEVLGLDKTGVVSHPHIAGIATCAAQAICSICNKPYGTTPDHSFDTNDECTVCGQRATISVTDGSVTYYATSATALNEAVTTLLNDGVRTFTVNLPADADAKLFTAIRRALVDNEAVADGSINLTIAGATAIPDQDYHNADTLIFGVYYDDDMEEVYELASINLPDVLSIGEGAFRYCSRLSSVTAPKLQIIGEEAFSDTALTYAAFPEVTTLEYGAFMSCSSLSKAWLPKATDIGNMAFSHSSLKYLELTAEGDISIHEDALGFPTTFSESIELLLNVSKKSEVTDGTTWNGFTFKSITFQSGVIE
ncbi:MAG: leucine-rich repeat domain-containing protein [Clostridia bacterium]|nr:leucine-rich repeat domain-containing protein [Clostridia bacterium]